MSTILRKFSIYPRLILCFLSIILISIISIAFISFSSFTKAWEENLSNLMFYTTDTIQQNFIDSLEPFKNIGKKINSNPKITQPLSECNNYMSGYNVNLTSTYEYINKKTLINNYLYTYCESNPHIANLQIVTPYDQFGFENTLNTPKGGYIKNHKNFITSPFYVQALSNTDEFISFDTTTNNTFFFRSPTSVEGIPDIMTLTHAIIDPFTHKPLGIIVINLYSSYFYNAMTHSSYISNSNILLFSQTGPILSLNMNLSGPVITSSDINFSSLFTQNFGILRISSAKQTYFLTYKSIPSSDMYLATIIDYKEVLYTPYNILKSTIKTAILVAIICLIIAYFVTRSIVLPLNTLKDTMSQVCSNNLNIKYTDFSLDEISILGAHFNQMICNIKELINNIYVAEIKHKDLELAQKNTQLYALQLQINPHFLYNTLDIIRWETISLEKGNGKTSQMIECFSNWLRYNIKSKDLLPLKDEIQNTLTYVQIINFRHSKKININVDLPFDISQYIIPKLTLQPILENALLHAFKDVNYDKEINITGYILDDFIHIIISDNGIGLTKELYDYLCLYLTTKHTPTTSPLPSTHIGLKNVNERLKLYFGNSCGITILPLTTQGLSIKITIPKTYI